MWPTYYSWIPRGVWGHTPRKCLKFKPRKCNFLQKSIQICSKIYANYTCIWNKRRKKRPKATCVGAYSAPPPPACMLKKALDFVCAFINKWVWLCKGCFSRRLTEMSRNAKTKTKNIMLNVSTIFIIFAISHHHSYTGVLHIWQSILKTINIGIIIKQLLDEAEHDIKNYSDRGQCYLPKRSWGG
jgi:hypothetical protein